jgi:nitrogen-specific signal transduction histidine kinase
MPTPMVHGSPDLEKQHGGRIDVETEPGQFTEFRIVLPRTTATSKAGATDELPNSSRR